MPPARTVRHGGSITLELIIAFAVASLVLTSVILLVGSSDALAFERESAERAIARELVDDAVASSTDVAMRGSAASSSVEDGIPYSALLMADSLTPCVLQLTGVASSTGGVGDGSAVAEQFADVELARALGGDCDYAPLSTAWAKFTQQSSTELPGTALDALGAYLYIGLSQPPYVAVVKDGSRISFANSFTLPEAPNALDAALVNGEPYVFAAMASSTGQFEIIDGRDPTNPTTVAALPLAGVDPAGSDPAAYHVAYYDGRAYVVTRYIAGLQPELHIFDVRDPQHAYEMGAASLETTVRGMALRTRLVRGQPRTYLYAATTYDTRELAVYDVTDPAHVTLAFSVDLPGSQDGDSIAIQGSRLYLGRASNTAGPELYVFDIRDPAQAPLLIGTAEVASKDITALAAAGSVLFVGATNDGASNRMLQAWDIHDPASPMLLASLRVSGLVLGGVEYQSGNVFALDASSLHIYEN
ncbi:MAG TPA: hypothetical protein VHB93_01245 [Candidatus Paceibacterota bacterium]|nr:hypothetical protein [Candidatus Paceibacterota bacterium]